MRRFEAIEKAIAVRWGDAPAVKICHLILEFAASKPTEPRLMLTYGDIGKLTGFGYEAEELQQALAILVSRFRALEMRLVFIDEQEEVHYLEAEEQRDFLETGELAHPNSGRIVSNAKERTFPYYVVFPPSLVEEVAS
jgi:alkylated DNA nucleotide flippase Atl1